jgi:hypothetical protein
LYIRIMRNHMIFLFGRIVKNFFLKNDSINPRFAEFGKFQ